MAQRVRDLMEERRLTQEEIAAALGISQEAISRRVRGKVEWRGSELVIVADLLSVDVADLFPEQTSVVGTPS